MNSFKRKQAEQALDQFWSNIKAQAVARQDPDCPICYNPFVPFKKTVLLDCSHVYHQNCLDNYEKFDREANNQMQAPDKHSCPMCRHPNYKKIVITY